MDALTYLNKIKTQFKSDPSNYNGFLDAMKKFNAQEINSETVVQRVSELFKGYDDLIKGFSTFLPPEYRQAAGPASVQPKSKESKSAGGKAAVKEVKSDTPKKGTGGKVPEVGSAFDYVSRIKERFADRPQVYKAFLEILHRYKEENYPIAQVRDEVAVLFSGHDDLLKKFRHFLPDEPAPRKSTKKPAASQEGDAPASAKTKTPGKEKAQAAGPQKALKQGTEAAKEGKGGKGGKAASSNDPMDIENGPDAALFALFKKEFNSKDKDSKDSTSYSDFRKCISLYAEDVWAGKEMLNVIEDMMSTPKLKELFVKLKASVLKREKTQRRDLNAMMRVGDLDFSKCAKCGTSYKKLPKEYPSPVCSGRTEWHSEILNDRWVCMSSGSEDFSFTRFRKNQYEMSMFKCEDDRFELDMLIEHTAGALRALSALLDTVNDSNELNGDRMPYVSKFKAQHIKVIALIYGDHTSELLENIDRAPKAALTVALQRLRQKHAEWSKARRDMNKIWHEVYTANYYKSLDHRSFYFKQVDKKSTSAKAFWQEIITSKRAAFTHPCTNPQLNFSFGEEKIHEDIHTVVMQAVRDGDGRMQRLFSVFLHVFLGLRKRSLEELVQGGDEVNVRKAANASQMQMDKTDRGEEMEEDGAKGAGDEEGAAASSSGGKGRAMKRGDAEDEIVADDDDDKKAVGGSAEPAEEGAGGGEEGAGSEQASDEENEESLDLWKAVHCMPGFVPLTPCGEEEDGENKFVIRRDEQFCDDPELAHEWEGNLLYGDIHCYVFMRLYQKLYERLLMAKQLANKVASHSSADALQAEGSAPLSLSCSSAEKDIVANGDACPTPASPEKKRPIWDRNSESGGTPASTTAEKKKDMWSGDKQSGSSDGIADNTDQVQIVDSVEAEADSKSSQKPSKKARRDKDGSDDMGSKKSRSMDESSAMDVDLKDESSKPGATRDTIETCESGREGKDKKDDDTNRERPSSACMSASKSDEEGAAQHASNNGDKAAEAGGGESMCPESGTSKSSNHENSASSPSAAPARSLEEASASTETMGNNSGPNTSSEKSRNANGKSGKSSSGKSKAAESDGKADKPESMDNGDSSSSSGPSTKREASEKKSSSNPKERVKEGKDGAAGKGEGKEGSERRRSERNLKDGASDADGLKSAVDEDKDASKEDMFDVNPHDGDSRYNRFLARLCSVVNGDIDTCKFEDGCRMILGSASYQLFTLETLVERLVRQGEMLVGKRRGKGAAEFISLYEYEWSRPGGIRKDLYEANAYALLSDGGFFMFRTGAPAEAKHQCKLTIELLEVKEPDAELASTTSAQLWRRERIFMSNADAKVKTPSPGENVSILRRNLVGAANTTVHKGIVLRSPGSDRVEKEEDEDKLLEKNGLEMRLVTKSTRTLSIMFEEGTCDILHRPASKRVPGKYAAEKRVAKMRAWQEERVKAVPEEEVDADLMQAAQVCQQMAAEAMDEDKEVSYHDAGRMSELLKSAGLGDVEGDHAGHAHEHAHSATLNEGDGAADGQEMEEEAGEAQEAMRMEEDEEGHSRLNSLLKVADREASRSPKRPAEEIGVEEGDAMEEDEEASPRKRSRRDSGGADEDENQANADKGEGDRRSKSPQNRDTPSAHEQSEAQGGDSTRRREASPAPEHGSADDEGEEGERGRASLTSVDAEAPEEDEANRVEGDDEVRANEELLRQELQKVMQQDGDAPGNAAGDDEGGQRGGQGASDKDAGETGRTESLRGGTSGDEGGDELEKDTSEEKEDKDAGGGDDEKEEGELEIDEDDADDSTSKAD